MDQATQNRIDEINRRLKDIYGITRDQANFRVVWSEDQFEMRLTDHTPEGFQLLHPEVRKLPKYRQYIPEKWVLERLTVVPVFQQKDIPEDALSYEPVWVFGMTERENAIPSWPACAFIVRTINENIEKAGKIVKYKHPDAGLTTPEQIERRRAEVKEIEDALFINETPVGDALAHGYGVGFTTSKVKEA